MEREDNFLLLASFDHTHLFNENWVLHRQAHDVPKDMSIRYQEHNDRLNGIYASEITMFNWRVGDQSIPVSLYRERR